MSDCEFDLSYKEALEHGLTPNKEYVPYWKPGLFTRVVAQIHHWYTLAKQRRPALDSRKFHCDCVIPRQSPPRCDKCFAPIGRCRHTGGVDGSSA